MISPVDMVSYAGELRRAARQINQPEAAEKVRRSAAELEQTALARIGQPAVGKLLDKLV